MGNIKSNKIKKYFFYALGEIVLVVIGILIALQLNNWNIAKQEKAELNSILETVKIDLEDDIAEAENFIEFHETRLLTIDSLIDNKFDLKSFSECKDCPYYLAGFRTLVINDKGSKKLDNSAFVSNTVQDSLFYNLVSFYKESNEANKILDDLLKDQFKSNIDYLQKNKTWFKDWLYKERSLEINEYFLSDPIYNNKLTLYGLVIKTNYLSFLKEFKEEAEKLLEQVKLKIK